MGGLAERLVWQGLVVTRNVKGTLGNGLEATLCRSPSPPHRKRILCESANNGANRCRLFDPPVYLEFTFTRVCYPFDIREIKKFVGQQKYTTEGCLCGIVYKIREEFIDLRSNFHPFHRFSFLGSFDFFVHPIFFSFGILLKLLLICSITRFFFFISISEQHSAIFRSRYRCFLPSFFFSFLFEMKHMLTRKRKRIALAEYQN